MNRCSRIWHTAVITTDGDLVPCCFDKEASVKIGSLKDKPLKELWRNSEFMSFRQKILKERASVGICGNCTGGLGRIIFR
jgi:radical SAM protein with 4Fe4S-binding SPASM domain